MTKITFTLVILLTACSCQPLRVKAQAEEIQQLLLNVEKLSQLKSILSDMKKGYAIVNQGYNAIQDISESSFNLHDHFLKGLLAVNPAIQHYKRVADTMAIQKRIVQEYQDAHNRFRQDRNLTAGELAYLARVYTYLFKQSLPHLDELVLVLTAGQLRMSDDERLQAIDRIFAGVMDQLAFLRHFNTQVTLLAIQRARERQDIRTLQNLYQDFSR